MLILRLALGSFMIYGHGWRKLLKLLAGAPYKFADPFGLGAGASLFLATFAEVACAALLIVGLFTRMATIPLIVTMLVAAFIAHGADPFADKEMALLYLAGYVALALTGPGWYSLDAQWRKAV